MESFQIGTQPLQWPMQGITTPARRLVRLGLLRYVSVIAGTGLVANPSFLLRIGALEVQTAFDVGMSRERLCVELQNSATLAKEKREPVAMIAAWPEIGKSAVFISWDG